MARRKDIGEQVQMYVDVLLELYKETDPAFGAKSETAKLTLARHAVETLWRLHDAVVVWAQAHLAGYSILSEMPELVAFLNERFDADITEDSHLLEQIGLQYSLNPPDDNDKALNNMHDLLVQFEKEAAKVGFPVPGEKPDYLSPSVIRMLAVEMLMSRSANSSFWRMDLQRSLRALNEGETDRISSPSGGKRQGRPFSLLEWKLEALRHVYFRVGKGMKKYRALEEVGAGIGQSSETLRDWEKQLLQSEDYENDLYCARLAGRHSDELIGTHVSLAASVADFGEHRGTNNLVRAHLLLSRIEGTSFEEIRSNIRKYRQKNSGG